MKTKTTTTTTTTNDVHDDDEDDDDDDVCSQQHLRELAEARAAIAVEGERAEHTAGALVQKWGAWRIVALRRANAAALWAALNSEGGEPGEPGVSEASSPLSWLAG